MKPKVLRVFVASLFAFLAAVPSLRAADENTDPDQATLLRARDRVYPALVNIAVIVDEHVGGRAMRNPAQGSGVIVSPAGHVLTNYHVAANATRLTCILTTGEEIPADVVTDDPLTDLSVLKLRLDARKDPTKPVPFAAFGDSDQLEVGDRVLALGNPRGLSSSMTLGIVSSTNRVFKSFTGSSIENFELPTGERTGLLTRYIQHDALIQPGNSGGPLINLEGEVVGINELGGTGMGFAIPSNLAREVLNRVLTFGEIERGWLGFTVLPVEALGREDGALVGAVLAGHPAAKAGLQPGDVILGIGGHPADVRRFEDVPPLYAWIANLPVGSKQEVRFLRDGEKHTTTVEVARMEPYQGKDGVYPIFGVTARAITGPMAFAMDLESTDGVLITGVRPGSAPEVARPSMRGGDVVRAIGGENVTDLESFQALQKKHAGDDNLLVRFLRGHRDMVTALDMTRKPPRHRGTELAKAWLGVDTQVMTPSVAQALGLKGCQGLRVTRVFAGSEAAKAGLQPGDVLVALDGDPIPASRLQDAEVLRRRIEDMDIASQVTLKVLRDGEEKEIEVTLEETPQTAADVKTANDDVLEYGVRELTYRDKVDHDWPLDIEGVLVAKVESGGWASVAGLAAGDLLIAIQGEKIRTLKDFERQTRRVAEAKPERVQLFVRRGRLTTFVFPEPEWPEE
jgi:S1-C subfamily serine protease